MRFVDLFAGLGGFHVGLSALGHTCVFASEIDDDLSRIYERNFGIKPVGDIRINWEAVPEHDILCAGFPCQPFSKAGRQKGLGCSESGDLFDYVVRILRKVGPRYFILENVPNLTRHSQGETWNYMVSALRLAGYNVIVQELSPHAFGVPQIRHRTFMVGSRDVLSEYNFGSVEVQRLTIEDILDRDPLDLRKLPAQYEKYLEAWQSFLDIFPADRELPSFPIWSMEFGANYPLDAETPERMTLSRLSAFRGAFGEPLVGRRRSEVMSKLPPYARSAAKTFPSWKTRFLKQNRDFYSKYRDIIDPWLPSVRVFPASFQKFEWNWKGGERDIWKTLIQFRASGIRVKKPESAPSLVALTASQVPVVAWERRYLSPRECARLQSLGDLKHLPEGRTKGYKALGNAVNAVVVQRIGEGLGFRPHIAASKSRPRAA